MPVQTQSEIVTHGVQLWLANDEGFYRTVQCHIKDTLSDMDLYCADVEDITAEVVSGIAERIESWFDDLYEEASDDLNPIFREFIADSINAINWDDLASYYTDEVREAVSEAVTST